MFGLKKIAIVATTLASLAVPSLALADDHDGRGDWRRDDYAVAELRAEIQRDRMELRRDMREHRWAEARHERREIERKEARLRELVERHHDYRR